MIVISAVRESNMKISTRKELVYELQVVVNLAAILLIGLDALHGQRMMAQPFTKQSVQAATAPVAKANRR